MDRKQTMTTMTKWSVITGAPCSGKSTVVKALADAGYATVPEVARAFIDSQLAEGKDLASIKSDRLAFERSILLKKVRIEQRLPRNEVVVLDRAVPDSIAYYQFEGLDIAEPLRCSGLVKYQNVFLFDRLEFEHDAVRCEDQCISEHIETLILKAYTRLGYGIVRVPVISVEKRVEIVLSHLLE